MIAVGEVEPKVTVFLALIRSGRFLMPWPAPFQMPQLAMSLVQAADPLVFARIVGRALVAEQRLHRGGGCEHAEPVPSFGARPDDIRNLHRAGAGHVLHHDIGMAGNVLAEIGCKQRVVVS